MVPHVQRFCRAGAAGFNGRIEYRPGWFCRAGRGGTDVSVKQVGDADLLETRVPVGHGDQREALRERKERGPGLGEQFDIVSHLIEYREGLLDDEVRATGCVGSFGQHPVAQESQVVDPVGVLLDDLFSQDLQVLLRKHRRERRVVLVEPGIQPLLRATDDRFDLPQRVVEIEGYRAYAVH